MLNFLGTLPYVHSFFSYSEKNFSSSKSAEAFAADLVNLEKKLALMRLLLFLSRFGLVEVTLDLKPLQYDDI